MTPDRDQVLALFADPARMWTAAEVGAVLGIPEPRVYWMLNSLTFRGDLVSRVTTLGGRTRRPVRLYQRSPSR